MRLNGRCCLICGELRGANLRVAGYEICARCEGGLAAGRMRVGAALPNLRRLAVKTCLTIGQ
ncbi:MAG: hypothetical protein FWE77_04505 [Clostridia bacterium]|nr:hypothetical protein [Clostridia bacterium]